MSTPLNMLLDQIEGIRRTGVGRYIACCPAHEDKNPSLAIRETEDGILLLHCFAGCDVASVVGAVGLDFSSLYPQQQTTNRKAERHPFKTSDLLLLAAWESLLASIVACDVAKGQMNDKDRLLVAASRLQHIAEVANVLR